MWQKALLRAICPAYTRPGQRVLQFTLGYWYGEKYLSKWNTFYDPSLDSRIYRREGTQWRTYIRANSRFKFSITNEIRDELPPAHIALSVIDSGDDEGHLFKIENQTEVILGDPLEDPLAFDAASFGDGRDIKSKFAEAKIRSQYLLDEFVLPTDECCSIAAGISAGTGAAVADGSFDRNKNAAGTAAFTLHANQADDDLMTGVN